MPINRNWLRWSATKLESALSCPLRCFFEQMLRIEAPLNAAAALGQAMHHMFEVFYKPHKSTKRYPYQSLDKFLGAWKGFYWQAVSGKHGFSGTHSPAQEVKWRDKNHPGETFGLAYNILKEFYERNHELRMDGKIRFTERRFSLKWDGITISGIIDRIDILKEGVIVLDYKPWSYPEYKIDSDIQMTVYQLAYEKYLKAKIGNNLPLIALQIYGYRNNSIENIPLRNEKSFGLLLRYIIEASEYYRSILLAQEVRREKIKEFRFFPEKDIERKDIFPKLPRGQHCNYCLHVQKCVQWETGNHENAQTLFNDKYNLLRTNLKPEQTTLPFLNDTIIEKGQKDYQKIVKKVKTKEQISFNF